MDPVKTPEDLDMSYKFFNKYSIKELMYRLIGLPFAFLFGLLVNNFFGPVYAIFFGLIFLILGWYIGSRKVLHNIPLLIALLWKRRLDHKSKILINTRIHTKVDYSKEDNSKLNAITNLIK